LTVLALATRQPSGRELSVFAVPRRLKFGKNKK